MGAVPLTCEPGSYERRRPTRARAADDDHRRLGLRTAEHVADLAGQLAERLLALDEWRRAEGFDPYGRTRPPQELAWPVRPSSDEGEGNDEKDDQRGGRSG